MWLLNTCCTSRPAHLITSGRALQSNNNQVVKQHVQHVHWASFIFSAAKLHVFSETNKHFVSFLQKKAS
jgi:hypothetical protein